MGHFSIRTKLLLLVLPTLVLAGGSGWLADTSHPEGRLQLRLAVGAALVTLLALAVVIRTTVRPLRRLDLAASRAADLLPELVESVRRPGGTSAELSLEPTGIRSHDEVGRVASAFDALQAATMEMAVRQRTLMRRQAAVLHRQAALLEKGVADTFVNLARRNQVLLDRQLQFLDKLEADEQDPDALANLFTLDQLATRVRRNSEAFLILAGSEGRRWEGPLAVAVVIRAGIAEVEGFARVVVNGVEEAMLVGNVTVEVVHLLSELLDNALRFSPPDTEVGVLGRRVEAGYEISMVDRGIGMSADLLAEANLVLADADAAHSTFARSVGLAVASRLAGRMGIGVRLEAGARRGVLARVTLPVGLMHTVGTDGGGELPFALARMERRNRISSGRHGDPDRPGSRRQ